MARATRSGPPGKQESSTCPLVRHATATSSSRSATPSSSNHVGGASTCISPGGKATPPAARMSRSSSPTHVPSAGSTQTPPVASLANEPLSTRSAAPWPLGPSSVRCSAPSGPMASEPPVVGPSRSRMPSTVRSSGSVPDPSSGHADEPGEHRVVGLGPGEGAGVIPGGAAVDDRVGGYVADDGGVTTEDPAAERPTRVGREVQLDVGGDDSLDRRRFLARDRDLDRAVVEIEHRRARRVRRAP